MFRFTLVAIASVATSIVALGLTGCSKDVATVDQFAQLSPGKTEFKAPAPTPTPDSLLKFRRAHEIPEWSQRQVVKHVTVKPGDKPIALTFDDGPWPQHTQEILAILAEHRAKATFYMLGMMVQEYPEIAIKVRDAGHSIGGHSWSHPSRAKDCAGEVGRSDAEFRKVLGFTPSTFRPPYGFLKNGLAHQAMSANQAVILWSADSEDWKKPSAEQMKRTILNQASPGGIVLFHDGGGARHSTVKALPGILSGLKDRGYRFVTVPELLKLRHVPTPVSNPVEGRSRSQSNQHSS